MVTVASVSCDNMHPGNITESEQAVFRNTMYMYKYMCAYIHIYMHITTIVKEDTMNMKESKGGRWEGLDGGNTRKVII